MISPWKIFLKKVSKSIDKYVLVWYNKYNKKEVIDVKMTISVDAETRFRLEELRRLDGVSYSEAFRRGIWLLYQDKCIVGGDFDDC